MNSYRWSAALVVPIDCVNLSESLQLLEHVAGDVVFAIKLFQNVMIFRAFQRFVQHLPVTLSDRSAIRLGHVYHDGNGTNRSRNGYLNEIVLFIRENFFDRVS